MKLCSLKLPSSRRHALIGIRTMAAMTSAQAQATALDGRRLEGVFIVAGALE
jgi:hypothetical protein